MKKTILFIPVFLLLFLYFISGSFSLKTKAQQLSASMSSPAAPDLFSTSAINALPYIKKGMSSHMVSSYDRAGLNADGGGYFYYRNPTTGGFVVLDEPHAGKITRMWATGLNGGRVRIYTDSGLTPILDMNVADFFSGTISPYLFPIVGDYERSSGGFYSYYPFSFKSGVRVEFDHVPSYYQISYYTNNSSENSTPVPDSTEMTDSGNKDSTQTVPFTLAPGQTQTVFTSSAGGSVRSFSLQIPQLVTTQQLGVDYVVYDAPTLDILSHVRIKMYWDNETVPSVDVPIGYLFGVGENGESPVNATLFTVNAQTHTYTNNFPMPYRTAAKIDLVNDSQTTISNANAQVTASSIQYPGVGSTVGYFNGFYSNAPLVNGHDFNFLNLQGARGNVVAVVENIRSPQGPYPLEGDERIFIDNVDGTPDIHGTGTEDSYNGGWYWIRGTFSLPSHGAPFSYTHLDVKSYTAYRLYLNDPLIFEKNIKMNIEHGGFDNAAYATFGGAVFAYVVKDSSSLPLTDTLTIGDTASETAHGYKISNQTWSGPKTMAFFGRDDGRSYTGIGRSHRGTSTFKATIPDNNIGVRLSRVFDFTEANQKAKVYVDDQLAGTWYTPGNNTYFPAATSSFEIPSTFTKNKRSVSIKIENASERSPIPAWSEYQYNVYAHVPEIPGTSK